MIFYFSLCSYSKFESILTLYDGSSKDSNKRITRLFISIIFLTAFIEIYLCILNDKFFVEDDTKQIFFLYDKSTITLIKKPIILSLYHAQAMNLLTSLNLLMFIIEMGLRLNISTLIDFIWFGKLIHELFQVFLAIHCSDNIFLAIPDATFHASFAIFYFWKQKRILAAINFIKGIYFTLTEKNLNNNTNSNEEYNNNNNQIKTNELANENHEIKNDELSNNDIYYINHQSYNDYDEEIEKNITESYENSNHRIDTNEEEEDNEIGDGSIFNDDAINDIDNHLNEKNEDINNTNEFEIDINGTSNCDHAGNNNTTNEELGNNENNMNI